MVARPASPAARRGGDEVRGAQRAGGEILARRGLVRELDALARAGEDHRVVADDIAAAQRREPDGSQLALAGHAFARVDRAVAERATGASRGRLAQRDRRAGWRVDLVPMMHLDDLDVVAGPQPLRGRFDEREEHVDAHAHVGRIDDRDALRDRGEAIPLRVGEPGGSDDGARAVPCAGVDVGERSLGSREIDQHIGGTRRRIDVAGDDDAGGATAAFTRVVSDEWARVDIERRRQHELTVGQHRLDQRLAHAAAGAGDRDSRRHGSPTERVFDAVPPAALAAPLHLADGARRGLAVQLDGRRRSLVAFPARELLVDEVDGEIALLDDTTLPQEQVRVIPAIVAEHRHHERRAEDLSHLRAGLAHLELLDHVLRQEIALVDVELVDAERAQRRRIGIDRRAAAGERGGGQRRAEERPGWALR